MMNFLYTILIYPVYLFVEFIFFATNIVADGNIGISIVLLSIAINILCLPMYNVAEQWQEKERAIQKKMKAKITDIKAVFKGDERYLILSTYYRQNNYHPLYALRSMFALFIQIPFFIAAYKLLSDSPIMDKTSFLVFTDLGAPDKLLSLGNISINILPIIMTLINIAASAVYTRGLALKDKLTLYITAFVFLLLLYNSPSGLVFYWTLNNLFSLLKNIFYKVKLSSKIWYVIAVIVMSILTCITTVMTISETKRPAALSGLLTVAIVVMPLIKKLFCFFEKRRSASVFNDDKKCFYIFLSAAAALCILIGLVIPSATIASSAQEFSNFGDFKHPLSVLYYPFIQSLGCLFWFLCIYKLFSKNVQKYFAYIAILLLTAALIDAFIFTGNYGDISNILIFDDATRLRHSMRYFAVNMAAIIAGFAVVIALIYSKFSKLLPSLLNIVILTFLVVTGLSVISIQKSYRRMLAGEIIEKHVNKAYRVSKTGKNIFILMLDRSMNFFIDPVFEHNDLVKKEYTGFTVFENSIAFGISTNMSTPSLFGGYEYTPENINKRSDELLVDKHNEALSVLPRLFSAHHWLVSFTDPPWLNYSWMPDLSVFAKYDMRAQNIDGSGKYSRDFLARVEKQIEKQADKKTNPVVRNMLYFSFFRILPSKVRKIFYNSGAYAAPDVSNHIKMSFIDAYSSLKNLCRETEFVSEGDCINIIVNNTPHEPPKDSDILFIGRGELIPLAKKYCLNEYTAEHFYANYLAHEACAEFFRFLKDNDCWDNSRIIIAGDHGRYSMHTVDMKFLDSFTGTDISPESLIPLIMMKDFNSDGPLQKDYTFMTLADIPILTTEGLAPEMQHNPFSGLSFKSSQDKTLIKAMHGGDWHADHQLQLTQFVTTEDDWVYVKENVYDPKCWSKKAFVNE